MIAFHTAPEISSAVMVLAPGSVRYGIAVSTKTQFGFDAVGLMYPCMRSSSHP